MQTSIPFEFFRVYSLTGFSLIIVSNAAGLSPDNVRSLSGFVVQADTKAMAIPMLKS